MGGQGSGRPPSAETLINRAQDEKRTPIGTEMFLPNFSVVQPAALRTSPTMISSETDPKFMSLSGSLAYLPIALSGSLAYIASSDYPDFELSGSPTFMTLSGSLSYLPMSLSGSIATYLPISLSGSLAYVPMTLSGSTAISNNAIIYVSGSKYYGNNSLLTISGSNVGIGTTSPQRILHVNGSSNQYIRLQGSGTNTDIADEYYDGTNAVYNGLLGGSAGTAKWGVYNGGTRMVIQNDGNVGIGTTNPLVKLHVSGGSMMLDSNKPLYLAGPNGSNPDTNWSIGTDASYNIAVHGAATTEARQFIIYGGAAGTVAKFNVNLGNDGNVGIGTTAPTVPLTVKYTSVAPSLSDLSKGGLSLWGTSNVKALFGTYTSDPYGAWIQPTDGAFAYPLILNPLGGNVGIRTASPLTILHVSGGAVTISNTTAPATPTLAGALFVSGGACWYIGSAGTQTRLAIA